MIQRQSDMKDGYSHNSPLKSPAEFNQALIDVNQGWLAKAKTKKIYRLWTVQSCPRHVWDHSREYEPLRLRARLQPCRKTRRETGAPLCRGHASHKRSSWE